MQVGDIVRFERIGQDEFKHNPNGEIAATIYSLHRGYAWINFTDPLTQDSRALRVRPDTIVAEPATPTSTQSVASEPAAPTPTQEVPFESAEN